MNDYNEINQFMPLRDLVFMTLRREILRGELEPGERLMEIALANRLGVSRTPVREAIRMLENEGLVVMRPRRGAQVARITRQELNDVLEIRTSLECLAIERACERMDEEDLEASRRAGLHFAELVSSGSDDLTALAEADVAFHDAIFEGTKNRRLLQILGNLREQMYRFRIEYLKDPSVRRTLVMEHREIYYAVRDKDVARARLLTREHIERQKAEIGRTILEAEEASDDK